MSFGYKETETSSSSSLPIGILMVIINFNKFCTYNVWTKVEVAANYLIY